MPEPPADSGATAFHTRSELFTLRVWREDLGEGRVEWRGKVQHVMSGETRYFRDWQTLVAFIQETLPDLCHREGETPPVDKD
jgi:hypothetical protein